MYLLYTKKSTDNEFSVVPMLVQVRVLAGFLFAALTALVKYENDITNQAVIMILYIAFIICMVLFYKKLIAFRLWYALGAILGIVAQYYLVSLPIFMIVLEAIFILILFLSPFIKKYYKKHNKEEYYENNIDIYNKE